MERSTKTSDNGQVNRKRTRKPKPEASSITGYAGTDQVKHVYNRLDEYDKVIKGIRHSVYSHTEVNGMVRRVKNEVSKRFNIWKPEIDLLLMAALFLQVHPNKMTFNHSDLFDYCGIVRKQRRWVLKLENMTEKGFLMHVRYKRTQSVGYSITEKGFRCLQDFDRECEVQEAWYTANKTKRRLKDCIVFLDKVDVLLTRFQEPIFSDHQRQQIEQLKI